MRRTEVMKKLLSLVLVFSLLLSYVPVPAQAAELEDHDHSHETAVTTSPATTVAETTVPETTEEPTQITTAAPTEAPVVTEPAVETTEAVVETTEAVVETTEAVVETTEATVEETTEATEETVPEETEEFLYASAEAADASVPTYISRIAVAMDKSLGDAGHDDAKGELTSQGFTVVNYNLNQGTGASAKIYMGYQTTTDPSKAITGIVFRIGKNPPDSITYGGATFYAIGSGTEPNAGDGKVDLNDTAGGDYIYTYVTRDTNYGAPLTALTVNNSSSTSGWTVATNTSGGAIDLNQDAGGKYIYLHYQRYSATIKATYYYIDANGKYASTTLTKAAKHHLDTLTGAPSVPEEFTYNGGYFTFTGNWRDDDEQTLEKEYYDQDISVSLSESGKAFRAGYLGWTQIAYDENGGSTPPDQVYYIGMAVWAHSTSITGGYVDYTMEKYNNPTHPSKCKFLGWSLDKNATTATYPDGGVIRLSGNGSIVYAVWDTTHTPGADTYTNLGIDHSYVCTDCGKTRTEEHTDANSDSLCDKCGGSTDEPAQSGGVYQISNKPELIWFMQYVNRGNKSASAIVLNDIDMGGYAWTPMAQTGLYYKTTTYSNPNNGYTGTFDGGGHVISNFKITASTTTEQTYGLFGTVSGTVKNLGLSGVSYTFPSGTVDLRAGGVVGQMLPGSTVENCFVRNSTITPGQYIVGGIAACNYGGTIENCYTYKVSTSGNVRCGNLVSDTRGDISGSDRPGAVINCYTDAARVAGTQTGNQVSGCQASVSAERFASGEITYLLNGSSSSGIWKQTVGTDDAPKFVGGTVYKVKQCDGVTDTYSNSPTSPQAHNMVNNVCTKCGFYVDGMVATVSKNGTVVSAHDTLQKAFDAAENTTEADNAVVTLLTEINAGTTPLWILGGAFTLDLNGKTIHSDTTNGQAISVELGADVTVTGNGTVVCTTSFSALCANGSGSSIVVMNGTFQSASFSAVIAYNGGEVTIHGGTFTGTEGARASHDGTVTIYDGSFNGSEYGISSYYADILTVYDGEFTGGSAGSGVGIHQSKADIHGGTFSGKRGLSVESYTSPHEVTISGGSISGGEYDIYSYNSNVTLTLAEGKTEGATFPGGITVRTTTLNAILGEGAAYWAGDTMLAPPADGATEINDKGDITIKAACTHANGTKNYVNNGEDHTYTWSCCNLEVTEGHTYDITTLLCVCGAVSPDAVASVTIGETVTYYTTLDGAVTAAKDTTEADEAVVTLLQSIDQGSTYQSIGSGVFTLDLNGKALSTTGTYGLYVNGSGTNVTITDSGEGGSIAAGTNGRGVYATSKSKVTISGGTVSGGWYGVEADDSTVTISGGTVSGSTISGVRASGSTVTISGGSISGNLYGVYAGSDSKITISGGTISDDIYSAGSTVTLTLGENGVGATFPGGIKVYGTTLNAILSSSAAYWAGNTMLAPADDATSITDKGDITIKAACTHENGTKSYVNNGEDHTYTWSCCNLTVTEGHTYDETTLLCVCGAVSPDAVASATIGDTTTRYTTLDAAIQAVKDTKEADKAVVTLLQNIDQGSTYQNIDSGVFTLDLNGKTLSTTRTCGLYVNGSGTNVTITDSGEGGSISGNAYGVRANADSNVTISGGTVSSGRYGMRADESTVTISGGTISGNTYGVYANADSDVTINGGTISSDRYGMRADESTVTISGGTISGDIYSYASTVTLNLGENGVGATFPGGITVHLTTLNTILGEGAAYWQGETMLAPADEADEITGGDVVVKAECTHANGTKSYVNNGDDHTCTYSCCNLTVTEPHDYDETTLLCPCGAVSPDAVAAVISGDTTTYYSVFEDAVADPAVTGSTTAATTVKLLQSTQTRSGTFVTFKSGTFTLDLNGCVLTASMQLSVEGADLTITDGVGKGSITGDMSTAAILAVYSGALTLTGGAITNSNGIGTAVHIFDGEMTLTGGSIDSYIDFSLLGGTVTLALGENGVGATFPGGILADRTTLNAILGEGAAYWAGETMIVPADEAKEITDKGDITIKAECPHTASRTDYTELKDGTNHSYVCSGCNNTFHEQHDYNQTTLTCVCGAVSPDAVASATIGETVTYYATLDGAITAVEDTTAADKAVVTLLKTHTLPAIQSITSGVFTLDLNGNTLSRSNTVLSVEGATVTLTGGTVHTDSQSMSCIEVHSGSLTVESGTTIENTGNMALGIYGGSLTVTGGTIESGRGSGLYIEGGEALITGGSFSGGYNDIDIYGEVTVTLALGENGVGATFPGGITVGGTTLNAILAEDAVYWQNNTKITPADDAVEITGGDVTVRKDCDHSGNSNTDDGDCTTEVLCSECSLPVIPAKEKHDLSYTSTGDTQHEITCSQCDYKDTKDHDFSNGDCICGVGPDDATTVEINLYLKAVDISGNEISGKLDVRLNGGRYVGTESLNYENPYEVIIGGNTLSDWDYYPDGYDCPTEDISFIVNKTGSVTAISSNAKAEKVGDNWYIVVTLTGGYVVPEGGYPVWVQGILVTDDNCKDVLGDLDEGATVTYDPKTNTLTLNGASIEGDGVNGIYSKASLNLTLVGENTMDIVNEEDIYLEGATTDLTIGGTGSLTFDGHGDENIYLNGTNAALIIKDSVTITCGSQNDPNGEEAIYVSPSNKGAMTIQDKVTVTVYTDDEEGIYVGGSEEQKLTISGGTVTVYADKEALDANTITISGGTVTAIGGDGYEGIYADDLTISGGSILAGTTSATNTATGDGVEADKITITGGSLRVTNGGLIASTKDADGNYIPGTITLGEGMTITEPTGGKLGQIDLSAFGEKTALAVLNADGTFTQTLVISDGKTAVPEAPKVFDIYLADIGMESGDYLAVDATEVTDTKPTEGGYAYYKDGTLTLHDYTYSGSIVRGLIATVDLKLVLEGTNSLTAADDAVYVDGALTVSGTGALTATAGDDGIEVEGNLTINGGTISASVTEEVADAINVYGKLTITGGKVSAICADGLKDSWGVYAGDGMEVSGGQLTASGAVNGIYVSDKDMTITGGTVEVLKGGLRADSWDDVNSVYHPVTITLTNVEIVEPEGGKTGVYNEKYSTIFNADGTVADAFVITDGEEPQPVYNVTFDGDNVTSDGAATATHGTAYTATLTVADGYELSAENISVVSDDSDAKDVPFTYDAATGKLTIAAEDVIVDLYIAAVAKQKPAHEHIDEDTDHICDNGCEEPIGTCEDKDLDHDCDYGCDKTFGTHADSPDDKDHICDYCKNADDILEKCSDKTGDKDHSCDVCGAENVTEHTQGEAVTEKEVEPTCTENGSYDTVVYCSECEKELSRETIPVPASGHTDKDGNYVCDVCEEDLCTEHTEETIPGKDATCTATGLTDGVKCAKCGDILQEQTTIPAKGHGHTEGFTCTDLDNGNHSVACKDCGETTVESEPHDYTADAENHKCLCGDVEAFTITWSIDGVDTDIEVDYNTVPTAPEAAKAADGTFTYDFKSWDKEIKAATEDTTYTAIFVKTGWLATDSGSQYLVKDEVQKTGWTEIDSVWYYLDPETGYRAEGVARVPYPEASIDGNTYAPNAEDIAYAENKGETFLDKDTGLFIFGEDGKFQSSTTGMGTYLNATRYAVNGMLPWHVGMVKSGSDYYYFLGDEAIGGNILSTGDIHVSRDGSGFGAVIGGVYTFGEDGKLCDYDGITDMANGTKRYYEDAQLMIGNGLTKVGSEYIYVRSNGELVLKGEYWVATTNGAEQYKGMQSFDEEGFMIVLTDGEKTGIYQEDGSWIYYKSGLKQYNVGLTYGTFTWHYADGTTAEHTAWIYVRSNAVLAEGRYWITNTNGEKEAGFYNFDEIGKLDGQKNGIVAENDSLYYYKADQLQYNAGVIKLEENYYYVRSNGEVVNGKSYWITNVGDSGVVAKLYEFDANGVMQDPDFVTEEGIIDGYYYINGSKAYGAGLLKLSDEKGEFYIYVRSNGALATGEYWPTTTNGYDLQGLQDFGTDGKFYI